MIQLFTKSFLILILLTSFTRIGFSQYKYEKESRIQKTEFPESAASIVDSMLPESRIRWYKEEGYFKTSFEAKTKYKGRRLSIEFSENGSFEDLEIEIKPNEIPAKTYKKITELISATHIKFSFEKAQIQYSGNPFSVFDYFLNKSNKKDIVKNYEIIISTKLDGSYVMFEYLFDEAEEFLQKSEIILKMTDNLEY